jgi:RNA polymerase sigma-70 factor (ECF subfamily)
VQPLDTDSEPGSRPTSLRPVRARAERHGDLSSLDDRELVDLAHRDRAAFAVLYRRHVDAVYRFAMRLCGGDKSVAEDVTASTFERALSRLNQFQWRAGGLRPWLLRIASSETASWYRQHSRSAGTIGQQRAAAAFLLSGSDTRRDDPRVDLVLDALNELNDRYRDVIILRYLAGLSPEDTADAMGCSKSTLAVTLHRALGALRQTIATREGR